MHLCRIFCQCWGDTHLSLDRELIQRTEIRFYVLSVLCLFARLWESWNHDFLVWKSYKVEKWIDACHWTFKVKYIPSLCLRSFYLKYSLTYSYAKVCEDLLFSYNWDYTFCLPMFGSVIQHSMFLIQSFSSLYLISLSLISYLCWNAFYAYTSLFSLFLQLLQKNYFDFICRKWWNYFKVIFQI